MAVAIEAVSMEERVMPESKADRKRGIRDISSRLFTRGSNVPTPEQHTLNRGLKNLLRVLYTQHFSELPTISVDHVHYNRSV